MTLNAVAARTPDGRTLFHDLTLAFGRERTGVVGRNGAGKTTLLCLLHGDELPAEGAIHRAGTLGLLRQESGPPPQKEDVAEALGVADCLAVIQRVLSGRADGDDLETADWALEARIDARLAEVGLAGLDLRRAISGLSGGERTRLRLAALLLAEPDLLLLDEPTNHLDVQARGLVHQALERWSGGAVVVSHDRDLLRRMDRIIEISPQGVAIYGGNYDHYIERRDLERAAAERGLIEAERQAGQAARDLQAASERQARRDSAGRRHGASGSLPPLVAGLRASWAESGAGRARRAALQRRDETETARRDAEARVERVRGLELSLPTSGLAAGKTVLDARGLGWRTPTGRSVIGALDLCLIGPERIAVVGRNGSGKSTLLKLAAGTLTPTEGDIRTSVRSAMLDQDLGLMRSDETLVDAYRRLNPAATENSARAALARGLFRNVEADRRVGDLSGGERLRAALVCAIGTGAVQDDRSPQLLLLDEPTNHLDLAAIEAVEGLLVAWDGALVVVSHDEDFLDAIGVQRRIVLGGS
ncbi:ATP-binding cassette domain-containing protein [Brevundimonas sp. VNH65]|uniref:ATP-binding cassette domain-containing protein n=1 Tax=Brevundimonas sp. VNH65 TaxID=3400917 RepID=UPI003BFE0309